MTKTFKSQSAADKLIHEDPRYFRSLFNMHKKRISINDILSSEMSFSCKRWFIVNCFGLNHMDVKRLSLKLMFVMLPIYENKHPDDNRVRRYMEISSMIHEQMITDDDDDAVKCCNYADDAATDDDGDWAASAVAWAISDWHQGINPDPLMMCSLSSVVAVGAVGTRQGYFALDAALYLTDRMQDSNYTNKIITEIKNFFGYE